MKIVIGWIILTSIVFVALIVFKTVKLKTAKYVLTPIISILYGFMLFFVGMSISSVLFYVFAILPPVICVLYIIKQGFIKKT
jgi:hypothetical protein